MMPKRSLLVSIFFLLFHYHSANRSASSCPKTSPYSYNPYNTDDVSAFLDLWVTEWYIGPELDEDEFEGFLIKTKSFKLLHHDVDSKSDIQVPRMKPTMVVLNDVMEIQNDAIHYPRSPVREVRNPHAKSALEVPKKLSYNCFQIEIVSSFLIVFTINYFTGKRENENLALAWTTKFAGKESILEKNFRSLGVGDMNNLLLRERQNVFKLYASGKRFCSGLMATIELKSRHNLISRFYYMAVSRSDEITIEVSMNDDAMDQVVFALARQKLAQRMQKKAMDLQRFAGMVTPPGGRKWVAEELQVLSESKEVAGDLITKTVLHQVFGNKSFQKFGKCFISMHFSDQHELGSKKKKKLVFKFAIPDAQHMDDMARLVDLVPYYIDLIGRYKLKSHARSETEAARLKVSQEIYIQRS